jgi:iron(III) transport system substrate-binding protein
MENVLDVFGLKFFLAAALLAVALPAAAADAQSIAATAAYSGADRQQKLVAAAQKEGTVSIYTSISSAIAHKLASDFQDKYGVKVKLWRAGDRTVLQRLVSERKTDLDAFDVVNIGSLEMEMLHREKLLAPLKSPYASNLVAGAVAPHNGYVATFVNIMVQEYNTNSVKKADLPKTYQDLLNPKWKGQLGMEATDQEWFYSIVQSMGEEKGLQYFRDLTAANRPSIRSGHSLLANLVLSGEVPLGITVYNHSVISAKKKGAPVDYIVLEPAVAVSFSMGISNKAANPNAALLFYEYMLTDGQKIFASMDYTPTSRDIDTPFRNVRYQLTNQALFLDQYDKWEKLWNEIIVKQK